jgi:hypothetical protein
MSCCAVVKSFCALVRLPDCKQESQLVSPAKAGEIGLRCREVFRLRRMTERLKLLGVIMAAGFRQSKRHSNQMPRSEKRPHPSYPRFAELWRSLPEKRSYTGNHCAEYAADLAADGDEIGAVWRQRFVETGAGRARKPARSPGKETSYLRLSAVWASACGLSAREVIETTVYSWSFPSPLSR